MMQDTTKRKRYIRQASAIAASGRITKPFCDVIPTHGAVALPANGGYSSTRVEGCRYKEILSFGSAYSEVAGSDHGPDGPFDTLAMTVIEKLNILDVVTCDRVVARVSSKFPSKDKDGKTINEPEFTTVGSRFEGLRIGNNFFAHLDLGVGAVCKCGTWNSLQKGFQGDSKNALMKAALFAPEGNQLPRMLGFSLAPSAEESPNRTEVQAQIYVPQFGTVYLGEFFVTQYSRQLTMLRVALGCPVAGDTTVATASMSGDPFPP
jgi:hypothetical protein